jgi:WD40 repeat protein
MESSVSLNSLTAVNGDIISIGDAGLVKVNDQLVGGPKTLCNFVIKAGDRIFCGGQTGELYAGPTFESVFKHSSPFNCAAEFVHNEKSYICVGSYSGEVLVFENQDSIKHLWTIKANENAIKGMDVKGQKVVTGCADGELVMIDPLSQVVLSRYPKKHTGILNDTCFVGSDIIGSVSRDMHLIIWNKDSSEIYKTDHKNSIKSISSDDKGLWVAAGDYLGYITVFDMKNENLLAHGQELLTREFLLWIGTMTKSNLLRAAMMAVFMR